MHSQEEADSQKALSWRVICRGALFMQRKVFWILMILLGMIAGVALPLIWAVIAQLPIIVLSWWIAYRSEWFD